MGNLVTPLDNLLMLYSAARYSEMARLVPAWFTLSWEITLCISLVQVAMRARSASRIYGWGFAAGVPLRVLLANFVNCAATVRALAEFGLARWAGIGVAWKKTEHSYPVPDAAQAGAVN